MVQLLMFSRHRSHPLEDSGQAAAQQRSCSPVLHQAWVQRGDVPPGLRLQLHLPQPIQQEESGRDGTNQGRKSLTRTPNASPAKFNSSILPNTDIIDDNFAYLHLPDSMQTDIWKNNFIKLIAKSVSSSSWHKYRSALNKLKSFSSNTKSSISWPLTEKVINGFTLWCLVSERLKPSTVKAYILAFSKLQKLKKMNPIQFSKSIADYLSMGADHSHIPNISHSHKQPVTFKILKSLKSKSKVLEDGVSFWAICSCAFFWKFQNGGIS